MREGSMSWLPISVTLTHSTAWREMLEAAGDFAGAERFYQQAINGGSKSALRGLASLWEETGEHESARRCLQYGLDAQGNAASPWTFGDTDDQG